MPVSKEQNAEKRAIALEKHAINKWEKEIKPWMETGLKEKGIEFNQITPIKTEEVNKVEPQVEVKPTEQASQKTETVNKPVEPKAENKPVKFADWHKEQEDKYGLTKNTEVTYNVAGVEKTGKFTGFTKSKTGDAKARISIKTDTGYSIASVSPSTIKGIKTAEEQKPVEEVKKEVTSKEPESEQNIISKMAEPIYKGGIEFHTKSGKVNEPEIRASADRQAKQLYDDIQNKDIDKLTNRLPVLQNKASRKAFEIATGIKLPNTVGGTTEAIRKFVGEEKYDKHFSDIAKAQSEKVEAAKAKIYNTERDALLDAKVPGQQGSTYRTLIDSHAKAGYSVKVDKVGIREVYKLVKDGEPFSVVLPKKMVGEYALEKMPKYVEPAKSEWDVLNDDLRKIDKEISKEKQFNKKVELNKKHLEIINKIKKLDTGKEMSNEKDNQKTETLLKTSEIPEPTKAPATEEPTKELTFKERAAKRFAEKQAARNKEKATVSEEDFKIGDTIRIGKAGSPGTWEAKIKGRGLNEENKVFYSVEGNDGNISIVNTNGKNKLEIVEKTIAKGKPTSVEEPAKKKGFGLHLIKNPSGTYSFTGTVPTDLMFEDGATKEQIENAKQFGERFGPKKRTFKTAEEATTLAKEKGYEFDDNTGEKKTPVSEKIAEETVKRDEALDRAATLFKKLGESFVKRDPNTMYSIGTEQAELAFEAVSAMVEAGYREFKIITLKVKEIAGAYIDNKNFQNAIEDAFDSYQEEDTTIPKRTETIENILSQENDSTKVLVDNYYRLIKDHYTLGKKIPNTRFILDIADKAYGGTVGEGKYGIRDAYDALETAMNKYVQGMNLSVDPREAIKQLNDVIKVLPTQTVRTEDQIEKQQFSTPPSEAYLAVKASGIKEGMTGLEPSAGDGNIATIMRIENKKSGTIYTNEIDARRRGNLEILGFKPSDADAEYLNSTLPDDVRPDVVVMNPPFSATGGRLKSHDTGFGAEHVRQALLRVKDGGRLVAIVGNGMAFGKPKMAAWWGNISKEYNVRANIGISGKEYEKYGTGFDNNIIVIDKTGPTEDIYKAITGEGLTVEQGYDKLEPLMKEDVYGRIKENVSELNKDVVKKEPEGNIRSEASNNAGDITSGRSGRGTTGKRGTGTKSKPVDGMGESVSGRPGEPGKNNAGDIEDGVPARTGSETKQGPDDGLLSEPGSGIAGQLGIEQERVRLKDEVFSGIEEESGGVYAKYKVKKATYEGAIPHPANISESVTMASIELPDVTYKLSLPKSLIESGALSDAQLEAVTYACQAHEQKLTNGMRKEYLIGDGTGMGKARTLLGIIYENSLKGKKKFIYITKSKGLINQLKGDMEAMGINIPVIPLDKYKKNEAVDVKEGILFGTYSTVSGDFSSNKGRYNQVLNWFGKDNDSVFVFDESHLMKNVSESYTPWGSEDDSVKQLSEGSQRGQMGVQFKKDLPNARFVNASATAATESVNLAYLTRLGLWGEGTPFKDFIAFLNTMRDGGVGAMELLARDMKANGVYLARSISYDGVNYDTLNHNLSNDEKLIYDDMADFWSEILVKMDEAAKNANMKKESQRIMKQFYSAQQRFFLQLMMSFQVESMIKDADTKLQGGNSVVISLFNTNKQQTDKKVSEAINNGIDIDSMDFSPKDSMKQMIEHNFPIYQYEEYTDEDGSKRVRQVKDKNGEPLINKENLDTMKKLVDKIESFRTPENPIDRIVNHFGFEKVAEITGRKKRIVVVNGRKEYRDRAIKGVAQKDINTNELKQFMDGSKRVAIISGAAATGFDLHASLKKKNQQRRVFYALQLSWSADEQMQSFGRVHRTMQKSAPEIVLVKTDIASQQRLINTIQSRLASLGAISKGERESLSGGIFSIEDITDQYGKAALGSTINELDQADLIRMNALDKEGNIKSSISQEVSGFLNRIMVLPIKKQNAVFDAFYTKYKENVEHAKQTGKFDTGVEKMSGEDMRAVGEPIVLNEDKGSGVRTELITIEYEEKTHKETIRERREMTSGLREAKNKTSKRGYLYKVWDDRKVSVYGPRGSHGGAMEIPEFYQKYENATPEEVEASWSEEYKKIPKFDTIKTHLVTGSIFPVYNKIFFDAKQGRKIKRAVLKDGRSLIGVEVKSSYIPKIKQNFGIGSDIYSAGSQELIDLINAGSILEFDNGWKISQRRVMGEDRIELDPGRSYVTAQQMETLGLFNEVIASNKRYFIPTDTNKSLSAMDNILKQSKPVRDLAAKSSEANSPATNDDQESFSAPITPIPDPMPAKSVIETVKNAPRGKKVPYAVASAKIGKQMATKKKGRDLSFLDAKNSFYKKFVDLTWPISRIEDAWADAMGVARKKIREIDVMISKVRGAGGMARQFIEDNISGALNSVPSKIRSKVYTELNKYLIAKRTVWLYENKMNYTDGGIDIETAQTVVEFVEEGSHQFSEEINRLAPRMWETNKKLLQIKRDHGVIDDELLANLAEPFYVPFYRDVEANGKLNIPKGEKYTNIGKGIKRIEGSETGIAIIEPLQNMMQNTYETFVNAYRADVMNKIIDMAESSESLGKMFEKVPPKWVKVGTIEYRGEVDMLLRPKLREFARKLGVTVEEKPHVGGFVGGKMQKVLGKHAGNKIELMIGATESQFSHELGHQLHKKYKKWVDPFIDGFVDELNMVADTRYMGVNVPASYVSYCRNRNEKFAEFVSMYITDRENLQEIAPQAFMEFETRIALDNNLREMVGFKPSNVAGMQTKEKDNWVRDWHVPQDRDIVSVLREGKIVSYRCPEEVADAIKNMHPAMFPTWFRIFTLPMSWLRKGAVTLNIGFIIPNSVRDVQESAFNARTIPGYDFLIGLKEYLTNGDMYKQYYRLGGGMDSVESGTRGFYKSVDELKYGNKYGKFLDQMYWKKAGVLKGTLETGWAVMKSPFDLISKLGEASEMASRIGTYRRMVVGMPDWLKWYNNEVHNADEAVHIARQATVDFQRFGEYGRTANELIPFINAAIQGYDKMVRVIKDDPKRALMAAFLYVFGPMMAFWLWNKDKEGYKAVPLQDKLNNFIIMNPDEKTWIKIPKGHIVKFIGNPVQVTMEKLYGTVYKSDASVIKQILSDASPIDVSSIPVSLRLIIEPIANYDLYWNREIEKPYHKAILTAGLRSEKKTNEAIKMIGKALNISPIMMQHEIEIVGAGTAKNILWLADVAMGKIDAERFGLEKMPVTKSFYGKIGEWGTDVDQAISMINKELAKTRSFSAKKMFGYSGYTPEEIRNIGKANAEKIKLLYERRSNLLKAKEAIKHLITTEE